MDYEVTDYDAVSVCTCGWKSQTSGWYGTEVAEHIRSHKEEGYHVTLLDGEQQVPAGSPAK